MAVEGFRAAKVLAIGSLRRHPGTSSLQSFIRSCSLGYWYTEEGLNSNGQLFSQQILCATQLRQMFAIQDKQ